MAEFCRQCAERLGLEGWEDDFKGLTSKKNWAEGKAALVLCEGCGPIQVDPDGKCVTKNCSEKHGKKVENG